MNSKKKLKSPHERRKQAVNQLIKEHKIPYKSLRRFIEKDL